MHLSPKFVYIFILILLVVIIIPCKNLHDKFTNNRKKLIQVFPAYTLFSKKILPSEYVDLTYRFNTTGYEIIFNSNSNIKRNIGITPLLNPDCYYHWLINDLPRILILTDAGINIIYTSKPLPKKNFVEYSLKLLNTNHSKLNLIYNSNMCSKDKGKSNIYKPFMPDEIDHSLYQNKDKSIKNMEEYHIHRVTKYTINRILTFFNIKLNKSPYRKIRIMRTDSREIKNSNEINNYLVKNGFEIIYLENYNITQQLQMIADSKIVFGSHGSGLVNCIALSPKSKLIEVCPKQYYLKKKITNGRQEHITKCHFHLLCLATGCQYQYIQSEPDYILPLTKLNELIDVSNNR